MTLIFLILAGLSYGVMWHLQFRYWMYGPDPDRAQRYGTRWSPKKWTHATFVSPLAYQWWYAPDSSLNKYRNRDKDQGPAFPGARWILTFLTEAFKFFQFLFGLFLALSALYADLVLPDWADHPVSYVIVWIAILRTSFTLSFHGTSIILDMETRKSLWKQFLDKINILYAKPWKATLVWLGIALGFLIFLGGLDSMIDDLTGIDWLGAVVGIILIIAALGSFAWSIFGKKKG